MPNSGSRNTPSKMCIRDRCVIGANGVEEVVELPLTDEERATFHACCEGIRRNMEHLKEI